MQAVDSIGHNLYSGLKTEGVVGAGEIVVDRLGHADHGHALFVQTQSDTEGVLSADRHEHIHRIRVHGGADSRESVTPLGKRVRARGAKDGAATREDARGALEGQLQRVVLEQARPAVAEANEAVLAVRETAAYDRTDYGVQSRAVTTPGEDSNACHRTIRLVVRVRPIPP